MIAAVSALPKRAALGIGERALIRNHKVDGQLSVTRLVDGINIEETLDDQEECVYVTLRELAYIMYLAL